MPHSEDVQANLELQFEKVDRMYANNDLRVFGRDTGRIFKEVDVIRRKQIELAAEHISLEAIDDMSLPVIQQPTSSDNNNKEQDQYNRNLHYFNKKEMALKSLMDKLDTLGQIMSEFREVSDLNPHTDKNRRRSRDLANTTFPSGSKRKNSSRPTTNATTTTEMSEATALKNDYYNSNTGSSISRSAK